jgi:Glycosyl transferase family 2
MSSDATRIVGITLVHNEDQFVGRAVRNAAAFCDEFLLTDHNSADRTTEILRSLAEELPNTTFHAIGHAKESHELIQKYANTRTWIFAVDGDEIYDPAALARLRGRILGGEFDDCWNLLGNVLNMTALDPSVGTATGHLSPPCRSMTKLYNFNAIEAWDGYTPERLHGGQIHFKPGYSAETRRLLHDEQPWESADFRCLHACFLQRSSVEAPQTARRNSMEIFGTTRLHSLWLSLRRLLGLKEGSSDYKQTRYMRGPAVTVPITAFFP